MMAEGDKVRAEIFETGNPKIKSARIVIDAPAAKIFDLLANPARHKDIDGSNTIQNNIQFINLLHIKKLLNAKSEITLGEM